ncbi:hypothetical protein E2C01_086415 [Portunus trituberculatus]|uniref:Uncharacterized protein n=1 Tax=Portunus trituberculatus TaxID=210409 RepID=A0A5B7J0Q6_PORTR|nr:hypothetical protein [Portunus trituberculatus]
MGVRKACVRRGVRDVRTAHGRCVGRPLQEGGRPGRSGCVECALDNCLVALRSGIIRRATGGVRFIKDAGKEEERGQSGQGGEVE